MQVRTLMRRAGVIPLTAAVRPGSPLLASIAGPTAEHPAPARRPADPQEAMTATAATGRGAAAASARYRRSRRR
jgi:hypothetical protein